jgi:hypothetical protein
LSDFPANEQDSALAACRDLTNAIFDGLDVTREIRAVADQGLGDTLLLWDESTLVGASLFVIADGAPKPAAARVTSNSAPCVRGPVQKSTFHNCWTPSSY